MLTKDGITIKRVEGYTDGPAVSFRSGDISLVVLRGYSHQKRRYLASVFAKGGDGEVRYMQLWLDRDCAKSVIKSMKG